MMPSLMGVRILCDNRNEMPIAYYTWIESPLQGDERSWEYDTSVTFVGCMCLLISIRTYKVDLKFLGPSYRKSDQTYFLNFLYHHIKITPGT